MFNIVCITDENYAQHAAVMFESLHATKSEGECFRIFCITTSLKADIKDILKAVVEKDGKSQIIFVEKTAQKLNFDEYQTGNYGKQWSPVMYMKLFIPQFLPQNIDRFLFLDVDLVVNHDLKTLYNTEFEGNIIAAAEDWKYSVLHKERIGLAQDDCYVNSGVMMIDLDAWRKLELEVPMFDFMQTNKDTITNDQDAFALYFKNRIIFIHQRWNVTTYYFEREPRILDKYMDIVDEVRSNPFIVHFCEPIKPWFKECRHPYSYLYKKYLKATPYKSYKFISCDSHFGKPAWRYVIKHWLNVLGLRNDGWSMVYLKH